MLVGLQWEGCERVDYGGAFGKKSERRLASRRNLFSSFEGIFY